MEIFALSPHQVALKIRYKESIEIVDLRDHPGSEALPLTNVSYCSPRSLLEHLDKLQQDVPVVLIGDTRETSKNLSELLNQEHGFGNMYYLDGSADELLAQLKNIPESSKNEDLQ